MNTFLFGWLILLIAALMWDMGARAMPIIVALFGVLNIIAAITSKP